MEGNELKAGEVGERDEGRQEEDENVDDKDEEDGMETKADTL